MVNRSLNSDCFSAWHFRGICTFLARYRVFVISEAMSYFSRIRRCVSLGSWYTSSYYYIGIQSNSEIVTFSWYPSMPCRSLGPHPERRLRGLARGGSPGPYPGGTLRGLARGVFRPTPGGVWGPHPGVSRPTPGGLQSHTRGVSRPTPRGSPGPLPRGVYPSMHWGRHPPSPQMATAAGGTHPTGMHSCFFLFLGNCNT